jgi:hypothetical protein
MRKGTKTVASAMPAPMPYFEQTYQAGEVIDQHFATLQGNKYNLGLLGSL